MPLSMIWGHHDCRCLRQKNIVHTMATLDRLGSNHLKLVLSGLLPLTRASLLKVPQCPKQYHLWGKPWKHNSIRSMSDVNHTISRSRSNFMGAVSKGLGMGDNINKIPGGKSRQHMSMNNMAQFWDKNSKDLCLTLSLFLLHLYLRKLELGRQYNTNISLHVRFPLWRYPSP